MKKKSIYHVCVFNFENRYGDNLRQVFRIIGILELCVFIRIIMCFHLILHDSATNRTSSQAKCQG
uniref:Uncharacterized protein n=1 Tax=Anguilla anguilla TaxID=7936 RepID=A0A0E9XBD2_ANGAN